MNKVNVKFNFQDVSINMENAYHALILSDNEDAVIIEPVSKYDPEHYFVYYQKDFGEEVVSCGVDHMAAKPIIPNLNTNAKAGDCQLRVL